jgi:hypothetical protein
MDVESTSIVDVYIVDVLFVVCCCHFTALDRALGTVELEDVRHWTLYGHSDGEEGSYLCWN